MHSDLMIQLEGLKLQAYDCPAGKRTVGIGFNMDSISAIDIWEKLSIAEDFYKVYDKEIEISKDTAIALYKYIFDKCIDKADKRAKELGLNYSAMADYKRFILADIAYNTGSVNKWTKVFQLAAPEKVLYEARRRPKELMDNRVAKIGVYFGIINSIEEAKELGLEYTTNIG